jgi:hypothetical protein
MRKKTTVPPLIKILRILAINKELGQYKLDYETKLSYRTVLRSLKPMENIGLIRLVRTEPSEKGGKEKKIYALTLKGLMNILGASDLSNIKEPNVSQWFDQVAEKSGYLLPLVLGKWLHFKNAGLEGEFAQAFQWTLWHYLKLGHNTKTFATERFWYYALNVTAGWTKVRWLQAVREDEELRKWASEEMNEWLLEGQEHQRIRKATLDALETTNEPDWNKVMNDTRFHAPKGSKYTQPPSMDPEEFFRWLET